MELCIRMCKFMRTFVRETLENVLLYINWG